MKEIQPFTFWNNGVAVTAIYMTLVCNSDNLFNQANFGWMFYDKILDKPGNVIARGVISMDGTDYENWNSNDYAWNWAAQKLGVTIIGTVTAVNLKK